MGNHSVESLDIQWNKEVWDMTAFVIHSCIAHIPLKNALALGGVRVPSAKETRQTTQTQPSRTQRKPYLVGLISTHVGLIDIPIGYVRLFRYQHVGIGNVKSLRWGSKPTRGTNASGFALQWNISFLLPISR